MDSVCRDYPLDLNDEIQRGKLHVSYGVMLKGTDRHDESLQHLELADEIFRAAMTRWPDEEVCQLELANSLNAHANSLWYVSRHGEGTPLYRESFELTRAVQQRSPSHINARVLYARHTASLVRIDMLSNDFDVGAQRLDEAARIMNDVVSSFPDNVNYLSDALWIWCERRRVEQLRNNLPMFDRACRIELSLLGNLMRRVPLRSRYDERFALATYQFADWLWQQDRQPEARNYYEAALQVLKQVAARLPDDATAQHQLAWSHAVCPLPDLRDLPLAEAAANRAVELAPHLPQSGLALSAIQLRLGQPAAAEAALRKVLTLNLDSEKIAGTQALLSIALTQLARPAEARESYSIASTQIANPPLHLVRLLKEAESQVTSD